MQHIVAERYECQEVGRHVAGSKKRYTWQFSLKDKHHVIVLDFSIISGKMKITVDRKILLQNQLPTNVAFQYPFTLDGFALNIIQQGETFQLRLNNKAFSHLYNQQKTQNEFKKYQSQVKDIKVDIDQLTIGNKKLSLNIGAFGGMNKKKKEASSQSQAWNAFAGNSSFPNYFGETSVQDTSKKTGIAVNNFKEVSNKTNLLDDEESQKAEASIVQKNRSGANQDQLLFQFSQATAETSVPSKTESLGNMQQLFDSLNVASQPPHNQIDFFAEQTPKQNTAQLKNTNDLSTLLLQQNNSLSFGATVPNSSSYTTGFQPKGQSNQLNSNIFATTNFNFQKTTELNIPSGTIAPQPAQIQQFNSGYNFEAQNQSKPAQLNLLNNPLTDININDFNTMQKLFQTNNFNQNNLFNVPKTATQPVPQAIQPSFQQSQSNQALGSNLSNDVNSYNTMQLLFTTSNPSTLNQMQTKPQTVTISPSKQNPLDLFSDNNRPATFSTISGVSTQNNLGLDALNFGTLQFNGSQPAQFSLGTSKQQSRPVFKKQIPVSNDLI